MHLAEHDTKSEVADGLFEYCDLVYGPLEEAAAARPRRGR
jgi:hypothetical protein